MGYFYPVFGPRSSFALFFVSVLRIFLTFYTMLGQDELTKVTIVNILKKNAGPKMGQNIGHLVPGIHSKNF